MDAITIPQLIKLLEGNKINAESLLTHRFNFKDMLNAYETFGAAASNNALKVVINF